MLRAVVQSKMKERLHNIQIKYQVLLDITCSVSLPCLYVRPTSVFVP
jgi:hypothetical protein